MEKQGVISLGEAFVDYIATDHTNKKYKKYLGGATVNLAVGTSRLGIPTYYLCKLGTDKISHFVEEEFKNEGIDTAFSVRSEKKKICGVYVNLTSNGERIFHSYINPTPEEVLTEDEFKKEVFKKARIFYFGSGTLFHQIAKETTEIALNYAKDTKTLVAFDANIRLQRWPSEENCRQTVSSFLKKAHIVKLAEDELNFLTETSSLEAGLEKISDWQIPYLFVTMGKKGAIAIIHGMSVIESAPNVKVIDTTGAGDAFMAGLLYCFHERGEPAGLEETKEFLKFANHVGAVATTELGSLTALMDLDELKNHLM